MNLPVLLLLAAAGAAAPRSSPERLAKLAATTQLGTEEPQTKWRAGSALVADVTFDGIPDVIVLGVRGTEAVVGIVAGPVTGHSQHWTKSFAEDTDHSGGLCGRASDAGLTTEPPVLPMESSGCEAKADNAVCRVMKETAGRLASAAEHGGRAIVIENRPCGAFRVYYDQGRFHWWRK